MRENMSEFYTKYHLNKYYFGECIGCGARTLLKYAEGKTIREESLKRIEKGIRLVKKYDLVKPYPDSILGSSWYVREEFKYKNRIRNLMSKEES